jgi:hypothetical protein
VPDQQETPPAPPPTLSTEIGASLASVWARYVGARPADAETEVDGNVIRWTLAGGNGDFDASMAAGDEDADGNGPRRTVTGYKRELTAAVARTTHRKVTAQISKLDKKTGAATETFILEQAHKKN